MRAAVTALLLALSMNAQAMTAEDIYQAFWGWINGNAGQPTPGLYYETFYPSGPLVTGGDDVSILGPMGTILTEPAQWRGLLVNLRTGDVIETTYFPVLNGTDVMSTSAVGYPFCERSIRNGWNEEGFPQVETDAFAFRLSLDRLEVASYMGLERNEELAGCVFTDAQPLPDWNRGDVWRKLLNP